MAETCARCGNTRTPLYVADEEMGSLCEICSHRDNLKRLVTAAQAALEILKATKAQGAAEARTELHYALQPFEDYRCKESSTTNTTAS